MFNFFTICAQLYRPRRLRIDYAFCAANPRERHDLFSAFCCSKRWLELQKASIFPDFVALNHEISNKKRQFFPRMLLDTLVRATKSVTIALRYLRKVIDPSLGSIDSTIASESKSYPASRNASPPPWKPFSIAMPMPATVAPA